MPALTTKGVFFSKKSSAFLERNWEGARYICHLKLLKERQDITKVNRHIALRIPIENLIIGYFRSRKGKTMEAYELQICSTWLNTPSYFSSSTHQTAVTHMAICFKLPLTYRIYPKRVGTIKDASDIGVQIQRKAFYDIFRAVRKRRVSSDDYGLPQGEGEFLALRTDPLVPPVRVVGHSSDTPSRGEDSQGLAEAFIVDETSVNREGTH